MHALTDDHPICGGHAGEWPYRHGDPRDRLSPTLRYDPDAHTRYPWWLPPRDRCEWSLEIVREREQTRKRTEAFFARMEAADRQRNAEILYQNQRRQTLAAVATGLLTVFLIITFFTV